MPDALVEQALGRATEDVLEKMFFAGCMEYAAGDGYDGNSLATRMSFDGERRGQLALRISSGAARTLATDFLGADSEDGLDNGQVEEVVKELTNMICGDALSALEKNPLRLSPPEIVSSSAFIVPPGGNSRSFDLGGGRLTVVLSFEERGRG